MKWTPGLGFQGSRLYGIRGDEIWSFGRTSEDSSDVDDAVREWSAESKGELRLFGVVTSRGAIFSSLRYRTISSDDSPEKAMKHDRAVRTVRFPLKGKGHLGEPSTVNLGPSELGAYPLAVVGSTIFAGTDQELLAVKLTEPTQTTWRLSLPGWRMAFLAVSEKDAYISTVDTNWTNPRLWSVLDGQLHAVEIGDEWRIHCLDADVKEKVWAAVTCGRLRGLLAREDDSWFFHEATPSGILEEVEDMATGDADDVWLATHSGIVRFRQNVWTRWTVSDGIGSDFHNSVCIDRFGLVWFWSGVSLDWAHPNRGVGCAWRWPA